MEAVVPRKLTAVEYEHLAASAGWDRTELIGGFVYDMAPEFALHANTVEHVAAVLRKALPRLRVRDHGTVRLDPFSDVDPDVFVMSTDGPSGMEPFDGADCVLVVEVASSSYSKDTGIKRDGYAAAGIPHYWVIEPQAGTLERCTDHSGGTYRSIETLRVGPAAADLDAELVARLFPADREDIV